MATIDELQKQLTAATAEQRRLQAELDRARAAVRDAQVDAFAAKIEKDPNPHALLEWIEYRLWEPDAQAWIAKPLNTYFVAVAEVPALPACETFAELPNRNLTKGN